MKMFYHGDHWRDSGLKFFLLYFNMEPRLKTEMK